MPGSRSSAHAYFHHHSNSWLLLVFFPRDFILTRKFELPYKDCLPCILKQIPFRRQNMYALPPSSARFPSESLSLTSLFFLSLYSLPHLRLVLDRWCFFSQQANIVRWKVQPIIVLSLLINGQNLDQQGGSAPIYCVK